LSDNRYIPLKLNPEGTPMAETATAPSTPALPTGTGTVSSAAPGAAPMAPTGAGFEQFIPLIAIFAIFYFLIIRPQQKRMKEHQGMMNALKKGDRIVTGGGIIGTVVHAPEGASEITVDLTDSVRVSVLRATIASVIRPETANDDASSQKKSA
jgi:preprotein translocase subunit YajC